MFYYLRSVILFINWLFGLILLLMNPWWLFNAKSFIYISSSSSSSSSCRAASMDIPDSLSPLFPIVHCWSSGLHLVSSHCCGMYVLAGRPAFARLYVGVYKSTSMSSFLLLQQCPACLVRLTWIVFVMGGRWPDSWCFVGCCRQDLFNIALNILV